MANLICKYNVTSTTESTRLCYNTTSFSDIYINGGDVGLVTGFTFSTLGEHTVTFRLNDPTTIDGWAFYYCASLISVEFPDTLTSIGYRAFSWCTGLSSITIPDNITDIGDYAFTDCTGLTSISLPNSITTLGEYLFSDCSNLTSILIPDSVTTISTGAFMNCSSLTSIAIPANVTYIGDSVFLSCSSLNTITSYPRIAPTITDNTFRNVRRIGILYYPEGSDYSTWYDINFGPFLYEGWYGVEIGSEPKASVKCEYFTGVYKTRQICYRTDSFTDILVDGVSIGLVTSYTFNTTEEHSPEVEFILKDPTTIGEFAFYRCTGMSYTVIPPTVETIGKYAFYDCFDTTIPIIIPDSVKTIGEYAFFGGNNFINELVIGSGVTSIGSYAFANTFSTITSYAPTAPQIEYDTFRFQDTGGTLTYPEGSDYSTWLSPNRYYLGYYGWNGVTPDATEPYFNIDTTSLEFNIDGTPKTDNMLTVSGYGISKLSSGYRGSWCRIDVDNAILVEGSGTDISEHRVYKIPVIVQENEGEPRRSTPTLYYSLFQEVFAEEISITIKQDGVGDSSTISDGYYEIQQYAQEMTIAVSQSYMASWDVVELEQGDNFATIIRYDFTTGEILLDIKTNNLLDYRECVVYIKGTDIIGNKREGRIYITQDPADEDKDPNIVVSKTQITLDNIGDSSTVQVTYINVDDILPPSVGEGFEIEIVESVESDEGIQVKYKIQRVSAKGVNTSINFQGSTEAGKTATSNDVNISGAPVPADVKISTIWPHENGVFYIGEDGNTSHINLNVDNPTSPYEMTYKIYDDNNAVACTKEEAFDYDDVVYFNYYFETIENNTTKPFTGSIDFTYKDELTNKTLSVPFYIRYATEGRIEAGSERYEYDKDGNSTFTLNGGDFSIRYYNINSFNIPVCDADWVIVGQPQVDNKDTDEYARLSYSIIVRPNSGPERKCTVTFGGRGIDGKDYSLSIDVKQEGTNTVKPIDEGFIELQQLSVELMADGGAQTFQVKYYDAKEIFEPELEFDWATITEVSRTEPVPDVAWNGEECDSVMVTYRVTAEPTESGRQMKVKFFSDINYYDGGVVHMEKDKFIIFQLAEGSNEVQGQVSILRYSNAFTYYGAPTGWDFRVAYKNVVPETPIISESWCRISEVIDRTADGYDYYKEYKLEMDTNNSTLSRTCTITFIGDCEDGTQIKMPFPFIQQGQKEIINEGEYDNYKGYFMDFEGALHSVSFITNPRSDTYGDIRLAGDSPVIVSYSESDKLYDPIRTSTCTVKVVSSHYLMNLYSGKAHGTQVIVKNEDRNIIEWCGYLQPNLYNQGFVNCLEEIEFEASDCLSTLQYLKYEYYYNGNNQPMIVSFKNIIDSIADKSKLINNYRFTQKLVSNSDVSKIFDFKDFYISENNFYSEEGEPWTYKEVLEEICKYFGYVCFQWNDSIYFIDYDQYQSNKSMVGYLYAKADGWRNKNYRTISSPNSITEKSIRGTGADISLDDVFNKVSVKCNYYNVENVIPDMFEDDNLTERNGITITTVVNRGSEIGSKTSFITYDHKDIISHFYKPLAGVGASALHETEVTPTQEEFADKRFFKSFVGANIVDMYHLDYSDVKGTSYESKEWERYLMISQLNRPWCGYEGTWYWENYNFPIMEFKQLPQIFIDNNEEVYATRTTADMTPSTRIGFGSSSTTPRGDRNNNVITANKSEHFLVINAEAAFSPNFDVPFIDENADPKGFGKKSNNYYEGFYFDKIRTNGDEVTPALTFYLEIPKAGWWDGSKWVDYETWFEVPLENLNYLNDLWYTSKNVENKVNTNLFLSTTGYKIQLPKVMDNTSFMQFKIGMPKRFAHIADIEGGDTTGKAGNAYCFIKDLEVKIVSRNSALMKDEDIVYENVIEDNNVVDGPEIDLKITSDNNITYSFSTVSTKYGDDEKSTTNFRFYDLNGELILPEEAIVEKYVNQYSTPTLKENVTVDMSFTPVQMITDTYWDKNFVIVGQEIDYQMCSQRITLLEKK